MKESDGQVHVCTNPTIIEHGQKGAIGKVLDLSEETIVTVEMEEDAEVMEMACPPLRLEALRREFECYLNDERGVVKVAITGDGDVDLVS